MKYVHLLVPCLCVLYASGQDNPEPDYIWPLILVGRNDIAISGVNISKNVSFTKGLGYWYIKNDDAFFELTFSTKLNGRIFQLELVWDGLENEQSIVYLNVDHQTRFFVYSEFSDEATLRYRPDNNNTDDIRVHIKNKTLTEVEGSYDGDISTQNRLASAQGFTKVHVVGVFHFRLDKPRYLSNGSFGNCDPIIYNRILGARLRSCSECELKFNAWLGEHFEKAVRPVISYFESLGFKNQVVPGHELETLGTHSENHFYKVNSSTYYSLTVLETEDYDLFRKQGMNMIKDSLVAVEQEKGNGEPAMDSIMDHAARLYAKRIENNKDNLSIWIHINEDQKLAFNGEVTNRPLNGTSFFIEAGQRKGQTSAEYLTLHLSPFETKIGLGNWATATVKKENENYIVRLVPSFDEKASHLSVQCLLITLKGSRETIDAAVKRIDFQALRELLYRPNKN